MWVSGMRRRFNFYDEEGTFPTAPVKPDCEASALLLLSDASVRPKARSVAST